MLERLGAISVDAKNVVEFFTAVISLISAYVLLVKEVPAFDFFSLSQITVTSNLVWKSFIYGFLDLCFAYFFGKIGVYFYHRYRNSTANDDKAAYKIGFIVSYGFSAIQSVLLLYYLFPKQYDANVGHALSGLNAYYSYDYLYYFLAVKVWLLAFPIILNYLVLSSHIDNLLSVHDTKYTAADKSKVFAWNFGFLLGLMILVAFIYQYP